MSRKTDLPATCPECHGEMQIINLQFGQQYECNECTYVATIKLSEHAGNRWSNRSHQSKLHPKQAWDAGRLIPKPHGMEAEELRYHHGSRQAIVRKKETIVTTVDVTIGKYALKRAVIRELLKADDVENSVVATVTNECDISKQGLKKIADSIHRDDRGNGSASTAQTGGTDTPARQRSK